jgi:hypothetical protein
MGVAGPPNSSLPFNPSQSTFQAGPGRGRGSARCLQPRTRCAPTDSSVPLRDKHSQDPSFRRAAGVRTCNPSRSAQSLPGFVVHRFDEGLKS